MMVNLKYILTTLVLCSFLIATGCSDNTGTSSSSSALPSPEVDCGGSSCID